MSLRPRRAITPNLVLGLVAVFAGIWIATSEIRPARPLASGQGLS